jgi:hypothetical protein
MSSVSGCSAQSEKPSAEAAPRKADIAVRAERERRILMPCPVRVDLGVIGSVDP